MKAYIFRLNGEAIKIEELLELCVDEYEIQCLIKDGSNTTGNGTYTFEELEVIE